MSTKTGPTTNLDRAKHALRVAREKALADHDRLAGTLYSESRTFRAMHSILTAKRPRRRRNGAALLARLTRIPWDAGIRFEVTGGSALRVLEGVEVLEAEQARILRAQTLPGWAEREDRAALEARAVELDRLMEQG